MRVNVGGAEMTASADRRVAFGPEEPRRERPNPETAAR